MTDPTDIQLRDRLVALTRDLVLIPSIPGRPDDLRQCYEFVRNHLEDLPRVEIQDLENGGVASLIAGPAHTPRPEVMMIAHLDVVTHPDIRQYRSIVENGRIIGPGAGDMKGALAILMVLFRRFHREHPGINLGLTVTTDEETGGQHGVGFLVADKNLRCNVAMIPDGGSLNEITVEEKGVMHLRLSRSGHPAHAARPWLGDNPLEKLMEGLNRLKHAFASWKQSDHTWYPTCTVTSIGTENETINRLPAEAHALLDIRFPLPHSTASILKLVKECVGAEVTIESKICAEPTHLDPDPVYREITTTITGRPTQLARESGGSDARFLTPHNIPVLMSRPLVGNLHAPDEWIDIDSMVQFYRIYETYLRRRFELGTQDRNGSGI